MEMETSFIILTACVLLAHQATALELVLFNCPKPSKNGYILPQDYLACMCALKPSPGKHVDVDMKKNGYLLASGNGSVTVQIRFYRGRVNSRPDVYVCSATYNEIPLSVNFTIKYAFGADTTGRVLNNRGTPYVTCPGKFATVEAVCSGNMNSSVPAPSTTAVIRYGSKSWDYTTHPLKPGHFHNDLSNEAAWGWTTFFFRFQPRIGGPLNAYCLIRNPEFNGSRLAGGSQELDIFVIAAPHPPVMKIGNMTVMNQSNHFVTLKNLGLFVRCEVEGGYPEPDDINLTCGMQTVIEHNNVVAVLIISRHSRFTNRMECACLVNHKAKCNIRSTYVFLSVAYAPGYLGDGVRIRANCVGVFFGVVAALLTFAKTYLT